MQQPAPSPAHRIALDAASTLPLYRQIYERVRGAIADGVLKPGARVPSARALTLELGVARGTVEAAYALLTAEGYLQARGQAGTVVTPGLNLRTRSAAHAGRDPAAAAAAGGTGSNPADPLLPGEKRGSPIQPFQMGLPALDAFPRKIWARLGARCVRAMGATDMAYETARGMPELRREIAAYLQVSRGIACAPSQVFVTSGYRHTLELVARTVLKPGDKVWMEDPGYIATRDTLRHAGLSAVPVPVDTDGIDVEHGTRVEARARAAIVTPAHQSPLCLSLTLPRRLALLDWASRAGAWIIEDDYDGEYRYASRPLPALKSLDRDGRVLYAGTFSKVLFPSLRLAYLVVPEPQVEHFARSNDALSGGNPSLVQAIVTSFIREGHFARHIQRMRRLYAERREAARTGMEHVLGRYMHVDPQPGGMHMVLRLHGRRADRPLVRRMRDNGMSAYALSEWAVRCTPPAALLLNFTNIKSRQEAEQLARRILPLL
jgi:GntR family transcriptional regulator/MocR family aminotransferase